jgi:ParB-like chromosome segregation protein Spo0J
MATTERDFLERLERSRMRDIRRVAASTPQRVERERNIFDRIEDFLGSEEGIALSFAPQASIPVGLTETTIGLRNRNIPQTGLGLLGLLPVVGGLAKKVVKHGDVFAERALRQARNQSPMSRQIQEWRRGYTDDALRRAGGKTLTLEQLAEYADPNLPGHLIRSNEAPYLKNLMNSIADKGVQNPLEVMIRPDGRHILWEGNHRLAAAQDLGYITELPVKYISR